MGLAIRPRYGSEHSPFHWTRMWCTVCVPSYMGMAVFLSDLLPPLSSLGSNDGSHPAALLSPSPYGLLFPTPTIAVSAASHLERREGTKSHRRPTPPWATFAYASLTGGPSTVDGEARVWSLVCWRGESVSSFSRPMRRSPFSLYYGGV